MEINQNLKDILLQIMNHVSYDQVIRTDAVLILCYFAKLYNINDNKFREEYSMQIIGDICQLLHAIPSLQYYQQFQIALIKCVRNLINQSIPNQNIFFNHDGVSILVELIQKSQPLMIENSMNLLLELASNHHFSSQIKSCHLETILLNVWDNCG